MSDWNYTVRSGLTNVLAINSGVIEDTEKKQEGVTCSFFSF